MAHPTLPIDVLLIIMEVSLRHTSSRMMRTCRILYRAGARMLIGTGVSLRTSEEAISFLRFMRADPDRRFLHLRSLKISRGNFSRSGVHALRGLLCHRSLALETLTLLDAEAVLLSDNTHPLSPPTLFTAIASLQSLKNLAIDGCDAIALSLLRYMVAPLQTASLGLGLYTSWSSSTNADDRNPILLLTKSSDSLRELRGSYFDCNPAIIKFDVVYPAVRLINASYTSSWMPSTLAYIHAFPNLEHLFLTSTSNRFEGNGNDPNTVPHLFSNRECNIHDQENYDVTWEHLQEVAGSVIDLFVLGLVCHVPTVRVLDDISERMCRFLHDVIADMKPESLVVTVAGSSLFAAGGPMDGVLRQPAAQQLRHLELELCFAPREWDVKLEDILDNISATFLSVGIPLHSLVLTLNYGLLITPHGPPGSTFERACPLEKELVSMDCARAEQLLSDAIPSLQDVSIRLSTEREPHQYMLGAVGEDDMPTGSEGSSESDAAEIEEDFAMFMLEEDDAGW
ncbi:hypothetical protein K466DRAFT_602070 [Polyporus arcularius HHB13444]|uniref:F-box domain-containing protein n=1 Tax=Polyporus arcularius HHB13444 TaxID=1314778 RepID=A0A5C3P3V5_9APHY|nr:hypothetical protein K466DRAFT_602070 [Polyporus arcularius HHB13444]